MSSVPYYLNIICPECVLLSCLSQRQTEIDKEKYKALKTREHISIPSPNVLFIPFIPPHISYC